MYIIAKKKNIENKYINQVELDIYDKIFDTHIVKFTSSNHYIYMSKNKKLIYKKYKKDELRFAINNLLAGIINSRVIVNFLGVLKLKSSYYLISEYQKESINNLSFIDKLNVLFILNSDLKKIKGTTKQIVIEETYKKFFEINIQNVDYCKELINRVFTTKESDKNKRLDKYEEIKEILLELYKSKLILNKDLSIIHGDARINNMSGRYFLDFDHLRKGRIEYDIARFMSNNIWIPINEINKLLQKSSYNKINEDFFLHNYLHHNLTFTIQAFAENKNNSLKYYKSLKNILNFLGYKSIINKLEIILNEIRNNIK